MAKQNGVERVFVHGFMDGRDTLPTNGAGYIEQLQQKMREYGIGKIATVSGRYYAMDRDQQMGAREEGLRRDGHGDAEGGRYADPVQGVKESYNRGRDRRIHHSVRRGRLPRRAGREHSRWRCLHQLQLPR